MTEALAASPDDDADLRRLADAGFGLTHLRDGQLAGMRALAAGRDVLAVMPTGYGKSAIYQVPALLLHGRQQRPAVVVSPLISLQEDQLDGLRDAAGPGAAVAVNSSHSTAEQERAWQAVESGEAAFLFLAPEQLAKNSTVERIAALNIALFVVDEAHCVSSWHRCRRQFLLGYFGEDLPKPRGNCDTCTDGPALLQEHGVEHDGGAGAGAGGGGAFPLNSRVEHALWGPGLVMGHDGDLVTVLFDREGYRTLSRKAALGHGLRAPSTPPGNC